MITFHSTKESYTIDWTPSDYWYEDGLMNKFVQLNVDGKSKGTVKVSSDREGRYIIEQLSVEMANCTSRIVIDSMGHA